MDIRMKNMESSFEKTATEFKEVKQSHQTLFEQVQRIQQEMQMVQLSNLSYKNEEQGIAHLHKLEEDNAILKEKMAEKLEELEEIRCKNRDLESRMSAVSKSMGGIQDNSKLLKAEKSNQELVAVNEKLTTEVSQLQNELRQIHERGERMECTNSTCKSCIEALEYTSELLKSENEWLWSKHAMKESKASLRAFEERNAVLEAKLEVSASEKRELDTYIEELKNDLDVERNIITQYENKMHGLSADMKKVSSEKEIQQEKHKVEEAILEKQISILHEEKSKIEIELNNRNTQIQTLTLENAKLKQDLEKDSNILYEYRLQAESNIKSLNERVQYLQRNIEKTDQQQIEAKSTFESMNLRKIQLEIDLAKKEENFQRVMQENAVLKAKEAKEIDAILATPINVRLSSDEATPCISGAEFMSSGYLVICDRNNMKVKVLDNSFVVTGSVTLPSEPMDVSEINSNRAVVTLPELKQCMVIEILPTSLGVSPYNLCDKELWGIHMFGAEIYAVYENELNKRRGIIVLDFQKRKIKAVFDSPKIFTNPENVAVNNFGIAVIAVSDHASNSVTFMTTDGTVNCQYTDSDLQRPGGMCFDKRLNVIVCGSESKNLQVISLFGEKLKTILMPKNPISIAYREDDVIVVGFNNDNLLLLDLKILLDKQDGGKI